MAQANVLCLLVLCCAVFAQVGLGAEVEVDAQGGAATHEAEDGLSVLLEQLSDQLDEKDRQLAELADMLIKAQNDASVVSEHYEKRISSVQQELAHALAALDEQVEMSRQTEERMGQMKDMFAQAQDAFDSQQCEECAPCPSVDPRRASNADLRHDVDKLFQQEQARQRRLQHEDADSADNGPKEISIHCPSKVGVSIVDLDASQRDQNECLVLNVNGADVSSRLVLFCDGTTAHTDDFE